jgi:hypothetical protein
MGARRRTFRFLWCGVVTALLMGVFYLDRSPTQPYCLWRIPKPSDISIGEWIGYRKCLNWSLLATDVRDSTIAWVTRPLTVHQPGPDDNRHLFDETLIYQENKRVKRLANNQRPLITIALVTSLTSADSSKPVRSVVAERENLAGAYAAQLRINATRSTRLPYVRLAVVNAGDLFPGNEEEERKKRKKEIHDHLATLQKKLRQLARDRTLAASIVTINSTQEVHDALRDSLGTDSVAMISPTMSAEGFGSDLKKDSRPLFFQVNASNDDQVGIIYEYARIKHKKIIFFYPVYKKDASSEKKEIDNNDLYITSLYCDVKQRHDLWRQKQQQNPPSDPSDEKITFDEKISCPPSRPSPPDTMPQVLAASSPARSSAGQPTPSSLKPEPAAPLVPVSPVGWSADLTPAEIAKSACPPTKDGDAQGTTSSGTDQLPLVFYGGRYTEVAEFTQALRLGCTTRMPQVALAHSSARFLADRELARRVPHGVQVLIAYRGRMLTCDALRNPHWKPGESLFSVGHRADFYDDISDANGPLQRCTKNGIPEADRWLAGGWAAGGYDSLMMINDALLRAGDTSKAESARGRILQCLQGVANLQGVAKGCDNSDSSEYPSIYGTIKIGNDGIGRAPVVLLRVKDLATAFESPESVDTVGICPSTPQNPVCTWRDTQKPFQQIISEMFLQVVGGDLIKSLQMKS